MTPDAVSYRAKAAEMRRYAADARDAGTRRQFLDIAEQYDKLVRRAEARLGSPGPQAAPGESLAP